jgi:hypothetical protein
MRNVSRIRRNAVYNGVGIDVSPCAEAGTAAPAVARPLGGSRGRTSPLVSARGPTLHWT